MRDYSASYINKIDLHLSSTLIISLSQQSRMHIMNYMVLMAENQWKILKIDSTKVLNKSDLVHILCY